MARYGIEFLDPDTGLPPEGVLRHRRAGPRYAYPGEVWPHLERGQALLLTQSLISQRVVNSGCRDGPSSPREKGKSWTSPPERVRATMTRRAKAG